MPHIPAGSILAIRDPHTQPTGRLKAQEVLLSGEADVFFMEWFRPIDPTDLAGSFAGLAPGDASPTLMGLATICLSRNIAIVPCDLPIDETLRRLDARQPQYAPFIPGSAVKPY